jgi:tetratricopeptide (TPR) repeat protein
MALGKLGKHREGIECYDKALEIDPKDSDAWNNKGTALGKLGRYNEAIECFDKALEIDPMHGYIDFMHCMRKYKNLRIIYPKWNLCYISRITVYRVYSIRVWIGHINFICLFIM